MNVNFCRVAISSFSIISLQVIILMEVNANVNNQHHFCNEWKTSYKEGNISLSNETLLRELREEFLGEVKPIKKSDLIRYVFLINLKFANKFCDKY